MGWRGFGWRYWHWTGGWCPRHPWPPPWARLYFPECWRSLDPAEELRILEDLKENLTRRLSDIEKRIEELKRSIEGKE